MEFCRVSATFPPFILWTWRCPVATLGKLPWAGLTCRCWCYCDRENPVERWALWHGVGSFPFWYRIASFLPSLPFPSLHSFLPPSLPPSLPPAFFPSFLIPPHPPLLPPSCSFLVAVGTYHQLNPNSLPIVQIFSQYISGHLAGITFVFLKKSLLESSSGRCRPLSLVSTKGEEKDSEPEGQVVDGWGFYPSPWKCTHLGRKSAFC